MKVPDVPKVIPLAADPLRIGRHSQSPCGEEVQQVLRLASERPILGEDGILAGQEEGPYLIAHKSADQAFVVWDPERADTGADLGPSDKKNR